MTKSTAKDGGRFVHYSNVQNDAAHVHGAMRQRPADFGLTPPPRESR